ncbi:MAG: response regulator [Acidobacteria bacterium]|nr:response regulator [Acidobacteriota bacterium]
MNKLRIIIADDERPARNFLRDILMGFRDVEIVGEAENGAEALEMIKDQKPDLALLDLQMPEISGIEVVKLLRKSEMPLVAFITAYDDHAIKAFEINAVDYLLKPIDRERLQETLERVSERLGQTDFRSNEAKRVRNAVEVYEDSKQQYLERIPVKKNEEILLIPVESVASIIADGELLHITTAANEKYLINFRLKDIELRLDPSKFIRLSRGALANVAMFEKVSPMPGGTYQITLKNGQEITSSRLQSRVLRERLLKL